MRSAASRYATPWTKRCGRRFKRARRGAGPLSAVMADVDHFKRVDDEHGHGVGVQVLAELGELLNSRTARPVSRLLRASTQRSIVPRAKDATAWRRPLAKLKINRLSSGDHVPGVE